MGVVIQVNNESGCGFLTGTPLLRILDPPWKFPIYLASVSQWLAIWPTSNIIFEKSYPIRTYFFFLLQYTTVMMETLATTTTTTNAENADIQGIGEDLAELEPTRSVIPLDVMDSGGGHKQ